MRWLSRIGGADLITLGNGFLGVLAITYVLDERHVTAALLVLLAVMADGLDGMVARHYGSPHEFGRFLDSISDAVSFCLAPGLMIYHNFYDKALGSAWTSLPNAAAVISTMLFTTLGLLRLARFAGRDHARKDFVGLSTPAAAMTAIMLCLLWGNPRLNPFALGSAPYPVMLAIVGLAWLMISDIRYPRLAGGTLWAAAVLVVCEVLALAGYLLLSAPENIAADLSMFLLLMLLIYVLLGPLMAPGKKPGRR